MTIIRIGKRYGITKTFDGKEFRFYDAYRFKRDSRKEADKLRDRGYYVRILTTLEKRGSKRHEVYYRRK